MPLPTAAELTDPNATNTQMKQRLGQLAENVESKENSTEKANTAKSEAITAAATDATTKANAAEANAKDYTDQTTLKTSATEVKKDDLYGAITDSRGVKTWLQFNEGGEPTQDTKKTLEKVLDVVITENSKYANGAVVVFTDEIGRVLMRFGGDDKEIKTEQSGVDLTTWAFFGSSSMMYLQDDVFALLQSNFEQVRTPKYYGTSASVLGHQLADIGCNDGYVSFNDGVIDNTERSVTTEDFYIRNRGAHQTIGELENSIKGVLLRDTFKTTDDIQIPIDSNLRLKFTSKEYEPKNAVAVVNLGKNSITSLDADKTVIEGTRRAVEYLDSFNQRHTIILGHFINTDQTELAKQNIIKVNDWMKSLYFDRFIDVQNYLMSEQVWADVGLSKTQEDIDAIAAGVLPPSLGRDNAHLSAAVDIKLAEKILNMVISKGWYA